MKQKFYNLKNSLQLKLIIRMNNFINTTTIIHIRRLFTANSKFPAVYTTITNRYKFYCNLRSVNKTTQHPHNVLPIGEPKTMHEKKQKKFNDPIDNSSGKTSSFLPATVSVSSTPSMSSP